MNLRCLPFLFCMAICLPFAVASSNDISADRVDAVDAVMVRSHLPTQGAKSCRHSQVYRVTKLDDNTGKGTLRHALQVDRHDHLSSNKKSCLEIVFAVAGQITLQAPLFIRSDHITIDGCTAPGNGITIGQHPQHPFGIIVDGTYRHTHDVLLQCLRFKGVHDSLSRHRVGEALLSVDGDCSEMQPACSPDWQSGESTGGVSNLMFDRIVYAGSTDKLTLWGKVKNASISRSFFYHNPLALLVSFYGGRTDLQKRDISIQENIFADNNERNPQLRGWIDGIDIRHNIVSRWDAYPPLAGKDAYPGDGYGIRIKNPPGERSVNANIVGNLFLDGTNARSRALIYGIRPGNDSDDGSTAGCLQQGQLFTGSKMGKLFVDDNLVPAENCDHYSTIEQPLTLPFPAEPRSHQTLCQSLPQQVGVPHPNAIEREILQQVMTQCRRVLKRTP